MNMSIIFRVFLSLILIGVLAAVGVFAYQAGVASGIAQNMPVPSGDGPQAPAPYYWMPYPHFYGFPGFGFGFLGCLVPLFLLFLFFGVMRVLVWGPRWHMHRHWRHGMGPGSEGMPPFFEEWHRRAHDKQPDQPAEK